MLVIVAGNRLIAAQPQSAMLTQSHTHTPHTRTDRHTHTHNNYCTKSDQHNKLHTHIPPKTHCAHKETHTITPTQRKTLPTRQRPTHNNTLQKRHMLFTARVQGQHGAVRSARSADGWCLPRPSLSSLYLVLGPLTCILLLKKNTPKSIKTG
jgi:hypothetical protein